MMTQQQPNSRVLYTMAKGRDHETKWATNPESVPWETEIEFCVVMGLQV